MRFALSLMLLVGFGSTGCAVLWPVFDVTTQPFAKKASFEEVQQGYCSDIRFGLYEDAIARVEPALKSEFRAAQQRLRDIRFSDFRVESIEIDPLRTQAVANVVFTGYWLSSPYLQEVRTRQEWRRAVPTEDWYVTPDLGSLIDPPGAVSAGSSER